MILQEYRVVGRRKSYWGTIKVLDHFPARNIIDLQIFVLLTEEIFLIPIYNTWAFHFHNAYLGIPTLRHAWRQVRINWMNRVNFEIFALIHIINEIY